MITKKSTQLALVAIGLSALAFGARPAAASIVLAMPINAAFSGDDGTVSDTTTDGYDTQFTDPDGTVVTDFSGYSFTNDDITLDYTPTGIDGLLQPANIPVANSFIGTDILSTTGGGTLDLSLAGSYSGPTGTIDGDGGSMLSFTGTATITGGTLNLSGAAPFTATETQVEASPDVLAGNIGSFQTQPASFTASYGSIAPEPSGVSMILLILGSLGIVLVRAKKRQVAQ